MMMELVYMDGGKEPYTLSSIVAECADIKHRHLKILINKHKERLERFGKVTFKISPSEAGQNVRDYILNEQQATLLVTFLRNTEQVANFKENLVKAFFAMRDELARFRLQRTLEKPKGRNLHEAIESWENAPKHAHSTVTNLLLKGASGMNKKQLVDSRGGLTGLDSLTSQELIRFQELEEMAIALIKLNMDYKTIKALVFRQEKSTYRGA